MIQKWQFLDLSKKMLVDELEYRQKAGDPNYLPLASLSFSKSG